MIYYLFFIIILLIIIIRKRNRNKELFDFIYKAGDDPYKMSPDSFGCVDKLDFDVVFLDKKNGCKELKREIPYFRLMNQTDRIIKKDTIQNCNLIKDWNKDEKKALLKMLVYAQIKTKCDFGFQRKRGF